MVNNLKNKGPCVCEDPGCSYCSMIGDFKFQWYVCNTEKSIVQNQLERCIEICGALAVRVKPNEDSDDWVAAFDELLKEVRFDDRASAA